MKDYHRSCRRKFCSCEKNSGLDSIRTLDFCDAAHCSPLPTELISQLEAGHRVGLLQNIWKDNDKKQNDIIPMDELWSTILKSQSVSMSFIEIFQNPKNSKDITLLI